MKLYTDSLDNYSIELAVKVKSWGRKMKWDNFNQSIQITCGTPNLRQKNLLPTQALV